MSPLCLVIFPSSARYLWPFLKDEHPRPTEHWSTVSFPFKKPPASKPVPIPQVHVAPAIPDYIFLNCRQFSFLGLTLEVFLGNVKDERLIHAFGEPWQPKGNITDLGTGINTLAVNPLGASDNHGPCELHVAIGVTELGMKAP